MAILSIGTTWICWQAKSIESCIFARNLCPYRTWCCVQGVLLPMPLTISFRIWQQNLHLWQFKLSMCILSPHRHHELSHLGFKMHHVWSREAVLSAFACEICLQSSPCTGSELLSQFHHWHQSIIYSYANFHTCTSLIVYILPALTQIVAVEAKVGNKDVHCLQYFENLNSMSPLALVLTPYSSCSTI